MEFAVGKYDSKDESTAWRAGIQYTEYKALIDIGKKRDTDNGRWSVEEDGAEGTYATIRDKSEKKKDLIERENRKDDVSMHDVIEYKPTGDDLYLIARSAIAMGMRHYHNKRTFEAGESNEHYIRLIDESSDQQIIRRSNEDSQDLHLPALNMCFGRVYLTNPWMETASVERIPLRRAKNGSGERNVCMHDANNLAHLTYTRLLNVVHPSLYTIKEGLKMYKVKQHGGELKPHENDLYDGADKFEEVELKDYERLADLRGIYFEMFGVAEKITNLSSEALSKAQSTENLKDGRGWASFVFGLGGLSDTNSNPTQDFWTDLKIEEMINSAHTIAQESFRGIDRQIDNNEKQKYMQWFKEILVLKHANMTSDSASMLSKLAPDYGAGLYEHLEKVRPQIESLYRESNKNTSDNTLTEKRLLMMYLLTMMVERKIPTFDSGTSISRGIAAVFYSFFGPYETWKNSIHGSRISEEHQRKAQEVIDEVRKFILKKEQEENAKRVSGFGVHVQRERKSVLRELAIQRYDVYRHEIREDVPALMWSSLTPKEKEITIKKGNPKDTETQYEREVINESTKEKIVLRKLSKIDKKRIREEIEDKMVELTTVKSIRNGIAQRSEKYPATITLKLLDDILEYISCRNDLMADKLMISIEKQIAKEICRDQECIFDYDDFRMNNATYIDMREVLRKIEAYLAEKRAKYLSLESYELSLQLEDAEEEIILIDLDEKSYSEKFVAALIDRGMWSSDLPHCYELCGENHDLTKFLVEKDAGFTPSGDFQKPWYGEKPIVDGFTDGIGLMLLDTTTKKSDKLTEPSALNAVIDVGGYLWKQTVVHGFNGRDIFDDLARSQSQQSPNDWMAKIAADNPDEDGCEVDIMQCVMMRNVSELVFSIMKWHGSSVFLAMRGRDSMSYPKIDVWDYAALLNSIRTLPQLAVFLMDSLFENAVTVRDANISQDLMSRLRIPMLRVTTLMAEFPNLYKFLSSDLSRDSICAWNLFIVSLCLDENLEFDKVIPIYICEKERFRLVPVVVGGENGRELLQGVLSKMTYNYGVESDIKIRDDDAEMWNIIRKSLSTIRISWRREIDFITQTKHIHFDTWWASKCGGFSEGLIMIQGMIKPKREHCVVVICDGKASSLEWERRVNERLRNFSEGRVSIVILNIGDGTSTPDTSIVIGGAGIISVRQMFRTCYGSKVLVYLTRGTHHMIGNDFLATKLLNQ
uniref:Outer capsid protein VP2 n=1 Tax=Japanaut virus TaxID=2547358 RepID=A0A482A8S3_9REOV|nr:VP2 [Japanaut virus]